MPTVYIPGNRGGHNVKRNIPLTDPARDWKRITDHRGNTVGYYRDEDTSRAHDLAIEGIAGTDDWKDSSIPEQKNFLVADLGTKGFGYIDKVGGSLAPNTLPDGKTHVFSITGIGDILSVSFGPAGQLQPQSAIDIVLELQLVPPLSIHLKWDPATKTYKETVPNIGDTLKALAGTSILEKLIVSPLIITVDTDKIKASSGLRI